MTMDANHVTKQGATAPGIGTGRQTLPGLFTLTPLGQSGLAVSGTLPSAQATNLEPAANFPEDYGLVDAPAGGTAVAQTTGGTFPAATVVNIIFAYQTSDGFSSPSAPIAVTLAGAGAASVLCTAPAAFPAVPPAAGGGPSSVTGVGVFAATGATPAITSYQLQGVIAAPAGTLVVGGTAGAVKAGQAADPNNNSVSAEYAYWMN